MGDVAGPRSLGEALDRLAAEHGSAAAAIEAEGEARRPGATLTYAELGAWSQRLAAGLRFHVPEEDAVVASMMHRGCGFLAVYMAVARAGRTLLPLSLDHRDRQAEDRRWRDALEAARPAVIAVDAAGAARWLELPSNGRPPMLRLEDLEAQPGGGEAVLNIPLAPRAKVLALVFTGGTTRAARCVEVTESMVMHELRCYREVIQFRGGRLGGGERVLQLSSAYWGAALLGEIDVALACGGAAVFADARTPEAVWEVVCACGVTILGVVPAILELLPLEEVPRRSALHTVLAWADACPPALARRWRDAGVRVAELLIASEYWLALHSRGPGPGGQPLYFPVTGVDWRIVPEESSERQGPEVQGESGEVGELWLAGPMVSPGFRGPSAVPFPVLQEGGIRYLRTGDLVKRVAGGGLQFLGRKDMMVKVGGRWVDLLALEASLRDAAGVAEAAVLAGPQFGPRVQAFVCVDCPERGGGGERDSTSSAAACARNVREIVLRSGTGAGLHLLPQRLLKGLPRHPVTGKVDARRLAELTRPPCGAAWEARAAERTTAWLRCAAAVATPALLAAALRPRAVVPRLLALPYLWLSAACVAEQDFMASRLRGSQRRMLAVLLALVLPLRWLTLPLAPGFLWALRSRRLLSLPPVFWLAALSRCAPASPQLPGASWEQAWLRALRRAGLLRKGHRPALLVWLQELRERTTRWAASLTYGTGSPAQSPASLLAHYRNAAELFDGFVWYDSSGGGRNAVVTRGAPRLELTRAVAFSPEDGMALLAGEPVPAAFTVVATARYRAPRLRVRLHEFANGRARGMVLGPLGPRHVAFRVKDRNRGFPEVFPAGVSSASSFGAWRVVEVDDHPAPALNDWPEKVRAGSEVVLQLHRGEEQILSGTDFCAGWLGGVAGVGWWSGRWQACPWRAGVSPRLAGTGFNVVAVRSGAGPRVYLNGQPMDVPEDQEADGPSTPSAPSELPSASQPLGRFGVNAAARKAGHAFCAVLEAYVFAGHLPDEDVVRLSNEMGARAALVSGAMPEPEAPHLPIVEAALMELEDPAVTNQVLPHIPCSQSIPACSGDNREWEVAADAVDLPEVPTASESFAGSPSLPSGAPAQACGQRLRTVLERVLGRPVVADAPFAGADSLRFMGLAAALRMDLGAPVGTGALLRASNQGCTLAELEKLVEEAAASNGACMSQGPRDPVSESHAVWTVAGLLEAPLGWVLEARAPVDAAALRRALRRLCARHAPLRAHCEWPTALFKEATQMATDAAVTLETACCTGALDGHWGRRLASLCAAALLSSWPRFHTCAETVDVEPHFEEVTAPNLKGVREAIGHQTFAPPCTFMLIRCEEPRADFVRLAVSHALCDGPSFAPMARDLVALYAAEVAGSDPALPPAPNAMRLQQARLERGLALAAGAGGAGASEEGEQASYLGGWAVTAPLEQAPFWGHRRLLHICRGAGAALRRASEALNVPLDVLLVVALACGIALCDATPVVRLTLTVPMRDGPDEGLVVGQFADWRDLDVQTHPFQSLASVALQTAEDVRTRRWVRAKVAQTSQRILLNLVAAEEATYDSFVHRPELGCMRAPSRSGRANCWVDRPVEMQGWQVGATEWSLYCKFDEVRHPPAWASRYAAVLRGIIEKFETNPLAPLHPGSFNLAEA